MREQVNPKSLHILFEVYYLKSILLSYVIKLYYLKSCTVTLRHCREKEQLIELYIKVPIIVQDGVPGPLFFFEPYSLAVTLSLLKKRQNCI